MVEERRGLPRLIYPLRVVGMALGSGAVMVVLDERGAAPPVWGLVVFCGFVWPHLAWALTLRSREPFRAELRNLLADSAMAAAAVPLMQFNLLPSVLLVTLATVDKIAIGVRRLWLRSIPCMLTAALLAEWWIDAPMVLESSTRVVAACMPVLVVHLLSVGVAVYHMIRHISRQNRQLKELRGIDALTGLYGRTHWEEQAQRALARHAVHSEEACVMMLDIDSFKQINDRCGHTAGDDVIRAMSHIVRAAVGTRDCAGRYGGDEFAILLCGTDMAQAQALAQAIRVEVEACRFHEYPDLRFTSSIGIAAAELHHATPRDWVSDADAALYQAKRAGRNRVEALPPSRPAPLAR